MRASTAIRIGTAACALFLLLGSAAAAGSRIEKNLALEPGGSFTLDTSVGSVELVGTSSSGARIVITSKSDDIESRYDFDFQESAGLVEVKVRKKGNKVFSWIGRSGGMKFQIEVPRETDVNIDTSGGSISVEELDGATRLDTSGGSIAASRVRGDVHADTSGGSISVEGVEGDVLADTSGGGIEIHDVSGEVKADTSGGGIKMSGIGGDIVADTSGGGIRIDEAGGRVSAESSGGSVTVSFAQGNGSGGELSTSGGGVKVLLDPAVNLDVDASASGGGVTLDLPMQVQGKISRSSVRGTLGGGGATLKLRASGGGIRIEPR
jgi:hypothetical protein